MVRKGLVALGLALASPAWAGPVVATGSGQVAGVADHGVEAFLGVPFAADTGGANRWRAPQPVAPWRGVRDATKMGPACMQADPGAGWGPYTAEFLAAGPFSEDCLTLNLWRPAKARHVPVLVYIHGGGFGGGGANVPIDHGANLARRGVVVITIQYRLGVFGFLAAPGLSGNYGLLDQIAALRWVRANVARFGGDPANVTLAGESAGAASVNDLMVSPLAKGLFARAIAFSGASMAIDTPPKADAEAVGQGLLAKLGKHDVDGLRSVPAADLIAATRAVPDASGKGPRLVWVPDADGTILPHDPDKAALPVASPVPLLTGFNSAEMTDPSIDTPDKFEAAVRGRYGAFAERLLAAYPHATPAEAKAANVLLARDRMMAGLALWREGRGAATGQRIYAYRYDHAFPLAPGRGDFGAFHSSELPYVFGNLGLGGRTFGPADQVIVKQWQDVIVAFMRRGDPSLPGKPWDTNAGRVMQLGDKTGMDWVTSSAARMAVWRDYAASGGRLGLM